MHATDPEQNQPHLPSDPADVILVLKAGALTLHLRTSESKRTRLLTPLCNVQDAAPKLSLGS